MEGSDLEAHGRADTKSNHKSKEYRKQSSQGEVDFQPRPADGAEHKDSVEPHQEVSSPHEASVKENCLPWEVAGALLRIHKNPGKIEL